MRTFEYLHFVTKYIEPDATIVDSLWALEESRLTTTMFHELQRQVHDYENN